MENNILEFECGAIDQQGKFCLPYTGYGQDISPQFVIKNLSPEAKTIAVTLEDMSHPIKGFTHWVIWNLPAADIIEEAISEHLGIKDGETTKDGLFTLNNVACLGCCSLAPVMMIQSADGDETYGNLTKDKVVQILAEIRERA